MTYEFILISWSEKIFSCRCFVETSDKTFHVSYAFSLLNSSLL